MIITVTLNPAMDKTADIHALTTGGLNRLENIRLDAGGKGINVSKMIAALGGQSTATGFLGGSAGQELESMLHVPGIEPDFVPIAYTTRTNLKVWSHDYGITEFNEQGAEVSPEEMLTLREKLLDFAEPGVVFVFAGSLPRNIDPDIYGQLIRAVKERGATAFLDADGPAFRLGLEAGPDFIKPNKHELLEYFGIKGEPSIKECADLCKSLASRGSVMVALSMGAEGALFVSGSETLYAPGLRVKALSTVGAGDSMVGAFAYAFGKGMRFRDAAALAMAASAGAVTTQGTNPPDRALVDTLLKLVTFESIME